MTVAVDNARTAAAGTASRTSEPVPQSGPDRTEADTWDAPIVRGVGRHSHAESHTGEFVRRGRIRSGLTFSHR